MTGKPFKVELGYNAAADNLEDLGARLVAALKPMDVLEVLCNGLAQKRDRAPGRELPEEDGRRWQELLDLMTFVDPTFHRQESTPEGDPATLINRQIKEGLIGREEGLALKAEFMQAVRNIVGKKLTEKQVADLDKLLKTFNPAKILTAQQNEPAP